MRHLPSVGALFAAILALSACQEPTGCAGVGYYPIQVTVRDQAGNPQALGAVVTLYDGSYREQDSTNYNPLMILAAEERGGVTYDVQVTKRYYNDVWVRGVHAPGGGCVTRGVWVTVPVQLSLAAGAPAVRTVRLLPPRILLDRPPSNGTATFTPYVDANAGLSRAVRWSLSGDTGSVFFDAPTGTVRYRCLVKSGYLTLTATSVADSSVAGTAEVAVQGHPGDVADPPCS
jgi:hypothetical protein